MANKENKASLIFDEIVQADKIESSQDEKQLFFDWVLKYFVGKNEVLGQIIKITMESDETGESINRLMYNLAQVFASGYMTAVKFINDSLDEGQEDLYNAMAEALKKRAAA
jgi:hypothetical protein